MLNFPKQAEVNKFLPKEKLLGSLSLRPALKESLKNDVRRFTITHELSPKSLNIPKGEQVAAVFVLEVALKRQEIDYRLFETLARQNKQHLLFVLLHEGGGQLAVFYGKLYKTGWMKDEDLNLAISGLNFDEVWDGFVAQVALEAPQSAAPTALPVAQQLARQEEAAKLQREIERLELRARSEKQPKKKFELVGQIDEMKKRLEGLG